MITDERPTNTIIINLAGGPGCGKSTVAAGLFSKLKSEGYSCELVTEIAKQYVWEDSYVTLSDQLYIFGKQFHDFWRLQGKVQFIITDTCLPLSIFYNRIDSKVFPELVMEMYNKFANAMYFIKRGSFYEEAGRFENKNEALQADKQIKEIFKKYNILYEEIPQDKAIDYIYNQIKECFIEIKI